MAYPPPFDIDGKVALSGLGHRVDLGDHRRRDVFAIPAYNTAKGTVANLTRELGLAYATAGIQANAIRRGFFFSRLAGGAYDDPDVVTAVSGFTFMGRVADAREIRGAASFLASDPSSDMSRGQMLVLDGGELAK